MQVLTAINQLDPLAVIIPADADKHARPRLGQFARWMTDQALPWHAPDLAAYRDSFHLNWLLQQREMEL